MQIVKQIMTKEQLRSNQENEIIITIAQIQKKQNLDVDK